MIVSITQLAFLSMVSGWARLLALSSFRVARLTIRAVTSLVTAKAVVSVITFYTGTQHISPCTCQTQQFQMAVEISPTFLTAVTIITRFTNAGAFCGSQESEFSCTHWHSSEQPAPWVHLDMLMWRNTIYYTSN